MPLIIITGLPCSGKTHRAAQLAADFAARIAAADPSSSASRRSVVHLPSYHARLDSSYTEPQDIQPADTLREQIYTSAAREKTARAEEFSAVQRALGREAVVIADGLNYIKGYRYQLWCEAKAAGTRCCVVHVAVGEGECGAWNGERVRVWGWEVRGGETGVQEGVMSPESHTAVYGDRRGGVEGEGEDERERYMSRIIRNGDRDEDITTLKSLSLQHNAAKTTTTPTDAPIYSSRIPQTDTPPPVSDPLTIPTTDTPTTPPSIPSQTPIPIPPPTTSPPYTPSTHTSLTMRYEPPSPFSRWDTPLFTLPSSDAHPPYDAIWDACFPGSASLTSKAGGDTVVGAGLRAGGIKPHASTAHPTASAPDALQILTSATATVVSALLSASTTSSSSSVTITIPPSSETHTLTLPPDLVLTQPMLQRLRRKYTALQRGGLAHGMGTQGGGREGVVQGFVRFLEAELGGSD